MTRSTNNPFLLCNASIILYCTILSSLVHSIASSWIDPDTNLAKNGIRRSFITASPYELVFSDEFNTPGRSLSDGHDPRWTALEKDDYTNYALQYYSSSLATTNHGFLNISTIMEEIQFDVYDVLHKPSPSYKAKKIYQSAMIQSWNKFCFTSGIIEISAKLPGKSHIGGLWPAMWLLGNLARATYVGSSNNIWPWSYNTCNAPKQSQQRFSACKALNHYDLHSFQGRGAPEIDIIEAMAGQEKLPNTLRHKPYYSASLQIAPAIENYRPINAEEPAAGMYNSLSIAYGFY
jgi:hypothetical protein